MWGEGGPCAVGAISRPSNCSRGDAVHLWEATYVRKCLGSGGRPGTWHALRSVRCRKKKPTKKKPARCPRTGGAHSLSFTLQFLLWDSVPTTHSSSIRLLSSLPCLLSPSILSIFFFPNLIFSPSTAPPAPPPQHTHTPSHPSPDSHIHLLSSQHILACYCFSLRFGRPVFTNGLLPADQCFRYSCTNYRRSKMESSRAEWNTKRPQSQFFHFFVPASCLLSFSLSDNRLV